MVETPKTRLKETIFAVLVKLAVVIYDPMNDTTDELLPKFVILSLFSSNIS